MAEIKSTASTARETPDLFDLSRRLMEHSGRMLTQTLSGKAHAPSVGMGSSDPLGLREALPDDIQAELARIGDIRTVVASGLPPVLEAETGDKVSLSESHSSPGGRCSRSFWSFRLAANDSLLRFAR